MSIILRAVVTEEEKQSVLDVCTRLGITESEIIRAGLKKMGAKVDVKKKTGPKPPFDEETARKVLEAYESGAQWKELTREFNLTTTAISQILGDKKHKRSRSNAT